MVKIIYYYIGYKDKATTTLYLNGFPVVVTLGFLTISLLAANSETTFYTVDNPARGLLDRKIPEEHTSTKL